MVEEGRMITASYDSTCTCGCGRSYRKGAALEKTRTGWVLASCLDRRAASSGSASEVLEVLERARFVRDTAEAADRIRAARGGAF
jgi:hypothetical protein